VSAPAIGKVLGALLFLAGVAVRARLSEAPLKVQAPDAFFWFLLLASALQWLEVSLPYRRKLVGLILGLILATTIHLILTNAIIAKFDVWPLAVLLTAFGYTAAFIGLAAGIFLATVWGLGWLISLIPSMKTVRGRQR